MLLKIIIALAFIAILVSLGRALYFLYSEPDNAEDMVKALTWRICMSIALFLFVIVSYEMGWIKPHAITIATINAPLNTQDQ